MSEQLIADLRRDASRVRCSIAMEQNIHKICDQLTAAQQRVAFLTEQCRELSKTNAEFSEGNQRLQQRVAELERELNQRKVAQLKQPTVTDVLSVCERLTADNAALQARVAELESLK